MCVVPPTSPARDALKIADSLSEIDSEVRLRIELNRVMESPPTFMETWEPFEFTLTLLIKSELN